MFARVTKVMAWILPRIQSGECGKYREAERIKRGKAKGKRRYGTG